MIKDVPPEHQQDLDYIVDMIDWETNRDPDFLAKNTLDPVPVRDLDAMRADGHTEHRIVYGQADFGVNEIRMSAGASATFRDDFPYVLLAIGGHGAVGNVPIESPTIIRFGRPSGDEVFVGCHAAGEGVTITNRSRTSDLVLMKTYRPIA